MWWDNPALRKIYVWKAIVYCNGYLTCENNKTAWVQIPVTQNNFGVRASIDNWAQRLKGSIAANGDHFE